MTDFDELLPEEADERDQRLIHDLRRMYRADTQTIEHLARVRHHLPINNDSSVNDRESRQLYSKCSRAPGTRSLLTSQLLRKGHGNVAWVELRSSC